MHVVGHAISARGGKYLRRQWINKQFSGDDDRIHWFEINKQMRKTRWVDAKSHELRHWFIAFVSYRFENNPIRKWLMREKKEYLLEPSREQPIKNVRDVHNEISIESLCVEAASAENIFCAYLVLLVDPFHFFCLHSCDAYYMYLPSAMKHPSREWKWFCCLLTSDSVSLIWISSFSFLNRLTWTMQ